MAIIGSGRAAQALIGQFENKFELSVYTRDVEKAKTRLNCDLIFGLDLIDQIKSDVIFLCVPDDYIASVSERIGNSNSIVVHLAGSRSIEIISQKNKAVFWPIQSLKDRFTNFEGVPIYYESSNRHIDQLLEALISGMKAIPFKSSINERHKMHLSAVVTNNFLNYLLGWSEELVGRDSALNLTPILNSTLLNWQRHEARKLQTGPATRADHATIERHLDLLKNNEQQQELYKKISDLIMANR